MSWLADTVSELSKSKVGIALTGMAGLAVCYLVGSLTSNTKGRACRNCGGKSASLRCSICHKAVYCNRTCQKEDWLYHKRTCKKPEQPKQAPSSIPTPTNTKPSTKKMEVVREDDEPDMAAIKAKGYCHFRRTLPEEEQKLIGSIAPKKIVDSSGSNSPKALDASASVASASAWNTAGTWEERDTTEWAKERLRRHLLLAPLVVAAHAPAGGGSGKVEVTRVVSLNGDAQLATVRGTLRRLFEFEVTLEWTASLGGRSYSGQLELPDVSATSGGEYEVSVVWKVRGEGAHQSALALALDRPGEGVQAELTRRLDAFAEEYYAHEF